MKYFILATNYDIYKYNYLLFFLLEYWNSYLIIRYVFYNIVHVLSTTTTNCIASIEAVMVNTRTQLYHVL